MVQETVIEILEDIKSLLANLKEADSGSTELISNLLHNEVAYVKSLVDKKETNQEEKAGKMIGVGTKVSWVDHTGAWSGEVLEVHPAKVRRVVRNISAYNDGIGYQHEITRVGSYHNPVLYISIDGGAGGTALIHLNALQIDELVIPE